MPIYGIVISLVTSLANEVIFKPIVNDPRPLVSANRHQDHDGRWVMKPGMPSGHVLNASCIMVWALLEVSLRGPGFSEEKSFLTSSWIVAIVILMAPVPWARIYNGDHSEKQCLVAGILGLFFGVAAFYIRQTYFPQDKVDDMTIPLLGIQFEASKPWDPYPAATASQAEVSTGFLTSKQVAATVVAAGQALSTTLTASLSSTEMSTSAAPITSAATSQNSPVSKAKA